MSPVLHLAGRPKALPLRGVNCLVEVLLAALRPHDLGSHPKLAVEDRLLAGAGHRVQ